MGFWGKTAKISSIVMLASGGALTITGAALLGVGTQGTYEMKTGDIGTLYCGSLNWKENFKDQPAGTNGVPKSYSDFIKLCRETINKSEEYINTLPNGAEKDQLSESLNPYRYAVSCHDMMISGAVLTSIFSIVLIVGLVLFLLNRKK